MTDVSKVESSEQSGRRELLTKGAIAAAVAAVAGVAAARPAAAANGGNFLIGLNNSGSNTTQLFGSSTLLVTDGTSFTSGAASGSVQASIVGRQVNGTAGVYGEHTGTTIAGDGVVGYSEIGNGVVGRGGSFDFVANRSGRAIFNQVGVSTPPASGSLGTVARDAAGNLWYCHTANKWTRLGGPSAAGAFHAISPVRVYDSRAAAPTPGVMAPNSNRVISVKDARNNAGTVTTADVVPAGATAVSFNVTATGTTGGGNYLSVNPGDAASFSASTLNWAGGYDIANASVVKLDSNRQVKIFMGDQGGSSHVILDITGYYL